MPSPIVHTAVGYLLAQLALEYTRDDTATSLWKQISKPEFAVIAGTALLPDIDAIPGILLGRMADFHNQVTNSLFVGLIVSVAIGILLRTWRGGSSLFWTALAFLAYQTHVLMDMMIYDARGVMLYWPLTESRFEIPLKLFIGVEWSEGFFTVQHLYTIFTEGIFVFALFLLWKAARRGWTYRRT